MEQESPRPGDVPALLVQGFTSYRQNLLPASLAAIPVFAVYGGTLATVAALPEGTSAFLELSITLVGLVFATVVALPWFRLVLTQQRGPVPWRTALRSPPLHFSSMLSAAFLFWAGIQLGFRYLVGIPSVFILVWYGLFGFAVADGESSGPKAIGTSVRIGQGRRPVVATLAVALLFLVFVGGFPVGLEINPLTIAGSVLGLTVTSNVSMGAGAALYQRLVDTEHLVAGKPETKGTKKGLTGT